MNDTIQVLLLAASLCAVADGRASGADEFPKPYSPPCVERENLFEFTEKPKVRNRGNDKYEITFAVKANCDVTVEIVDPQTGAGQGGEGKVVRHLGSGVLGSNAPAPFQKNSLSQMIYWNGKDDLDWYVKEPEKLTVRVRLGLKPEFDKRLGGTSAHSLPGHPFGLVTDSTGVYVFSTGKGLRLYIRKYDHEGNYLKSLVPAPSNIPESRLQGMCWVEHEKGRRALHSTDLYSTTAGDGYFLSRQGGWKNLFGIQPAVVGERLYFANSGLPGESLLQYVLTDGSTDVTGTTGLPLFQRGTHFFPHLAASPDGQHLYVTGDYGGDTRSGATSTVWRKRLTGSPGFAEPFVGEPGKPGSDQTHLNCPAGVACDTEGRVYVSDTFNSRVQIFSPEGKYLASIPVDRPRSVAVHQKTGAVYVVHAGRVQGRSAGRISRFAAFDKPRAVATLEYDATFLAVDSHSAKTRLWLAGEGEFSGFARSNQFSNMEHVSEAPETGSLTVWEEEGESFKKILDFTRRAAQDDGALSGGPWDGSVLGRKVYCDPVREQVWVGRGKAMGGNLLFDLRTGKPLRSVLFGASVDDIVFDKRGYLHAHFNPSYTQGVGRLDPDRAEESKTPWETQGALAPVVRLKEVPYDYGESPSKRDAGWTGILPVKDQGGAKGFQDGIGASMRGDVAVESNIYYVPKMEEAGAQHWSAGPKESNYGGYLPTYEEFLKKVSEAEKEGEQVYFLRKAPGHPLCGPTIWTFDSTGELRQESAVIMRWLINGVHMDEDGFLYFVTASPRAYGERHFLRGQAGRYGVPEDRNNHNPFSGTLIKSRPRNVRILMANAQVKLDPPPNRPPDVMGIAFPDVFGRESWCWIEGAEWLYAGAGPIKSVGCTCQKQVFHLDWSRRSYVPEAYRHSIGILDTNGNLILHLGRFGNFDDASGMAKGGEIVTTFVRFVSGTDSHLVYEDFGERIVVLRLNYHVEQSVGIAEGGRR